jgi:hypothetical protein
MNMCPKDSLSDRVNVFRQFTVFRLAATFVCSTDSRRASPHGGSWTNSSYQA